MELELKEYQKRALEALETFVQQAADIGSASAAWAHAMQRPGGTPGLPYRGDELGEVPTVCLRIPTGGGKTLMAAHAIARIARAQGRHAHPVALWLVPSDMIREQTLRALATPGHPFRRPLEQAYGQALEVCALDALHQLPPGDFGRKAVVVVATIQSLRITNKAGRRAYASSEAWETHFRGLNLTPQQAASAGLACITAEEVAGSAARGAPGDEASTGQPVLSAADVGRPRPSLANWLAWQRPLVIVDEAHNAKTPLSLAMLRELRPSCVLDLTATPVPRKTNVLYSVSARELQAEDMIKLPVMLAEHDNGWQAALRDALLRRAQLEAEAAHEADYVRPIVLIQAEDRGGVATVAAVRQQLVQVHHVPEAELAVATGAQRELDGVNLLDPACPVRYVITVDALREGWDCPFAYVLCALQNLRSNQAVEQLLGRVLRMPYARRRRSPALNRAYAHVVAQTFAEAANNLVDRMTTSMGFDALSAAAAVQPDEDDLFGAPDGSPPRPAVECMPLEIELPNSDESQLRAALASQPDVQVLAAEAGGASSSAAPLRVRVLGEVSDTLRAALLGASARADHARVEQGVDAHAARLQALRAPAERGVPFAALPQLCVRIQGEIELIERETLAEWVNFDLLRRDPRPELPGFALVEESDLFEIYLDDVRIRMRQADTGQLSLDGVPSDATETDLVLALQRELERALARTDLTAAELHAYVQRVVTHLTQERRFSLTGLVRAQLQLARAIGARIDSQLKAARDQGFQQLLLDGAGAVTVDAAHRFEFKPGRYPARDPYRGRWQFRKHYYADIAKLKAEGEEFECARALDSEPAVRHWVRNLERLPQFAFWLPTATDYFYPDFVAELQDGSLLVVEYKGEAYVTNDDSREKRLVGEHWARVSGQRFVMVEKERGGLTMAEQIRAAILQ